MSGVRGGILVAGIGNIFRGDDAFGVEVARRLLASPLPAGVTVADFGIRGIDLVYALTDPHDAVILVDAARRGAAPGTVSLVRPEISDGRPAAIAAHDLDPGAALRAAAALGGVCGDVLLVTCEPLDCGGEAGRMGLSPAVAAAVDPAVRKIRELVEELRTAARAA